MNPTCSAVARYTYYRYTDLDDNLAHTRILGAVRSNPGKRTFCEGLGCNKHALVQVFSCEEAVVGRQGALQHGQSGRLYA